MAWGSRIVSLGLAEAVSAVRLLMAFPLVWAVIVGEWGTATAIFVAAVASDVIDGPLARRRGGPRVNGALLDHGADAVFVAAGLFAFAWRGATPTLLPLMVVLAFAQYAWDSGAHRGRPLRGNAMGRINGIGYYALVGAQIVAEWRLPVARDALAAIALGLIGTTAFSMSQRARAAKRPLR